MIMILLMAASRRRDRVAATHGRAADHVVLPAEDLTAEFGVRRGRRSGGVGGRDSSRRGYGSSLPQS
jgi:hypothetical protein